MRIVFFGMFFFASKFILQISALYIPSKVISSRRTQNIMNYHNLKITPNKRIFSYNNSRIKMSFSDIAVAVYDVQLTLSHLLSTQLSSLTPASVGLIFVAGLLTSFSPCVLSLVPLTMAYLGGTTTEDKNSLFSRTILYSAGLIITLSSFGLSAAFLGEMYGSATGDSSSAINVVPSLIAALVSLLMGLNLLELISFEFPSMDLGGFSKLSPPLRAFLLGGSSALIASPCSSPVLASLLAVVTSSHNVVLGGGLLLAYSLGYTTPVVAAGAMSGSINAFSSLQNSQWINTVLAAILVAFGTYSTLEACSRIIDLL